MPVNQTLSPALSRVVTIATRELSMASLCCLVRSFVSANSGASCLSVTVTEVGALAGGAGGLVYEAGALAGRLGFLLAEVGVLAGWVGCLVAMARCSCAASKGEVVGTVALAESAAVACVVNYLIFRTL